jgi:hypothetical protein
VLLARNAGYSQIGSGKVRITGVRFAIVPRRMRFAFSDQKATMVLLVLGNC